MSQVSYKKTKIACYLGYVTQAISINLLPLLYLTFQNEFSVSLSQLGFLATLLFAVQMAVDLLATRFGKYVSYRWGSVAACALSALGLVLMCVLPKWMPHFYVGVMLATVILSIGGGLTEVLISPLVDAIPEEGKVGEMSLLHSFYCWGVVAVILFSTAFFALVGVSYWRWLVLLWSLVPAVTAVMFACIPIPPKTEEVHSHRSAPSVVRYGLFWVLMALMVFSGASEMAPAQWASFFAENNLGIPKAVGDLLGPCAFAVFQGLSRVVFSRMARRRDPRRILAWHAVGCLVAYAVIVLAPHPLLSLFGFCMCGWFVGPMWPGILSLCATRFPAGGTAMFAALALCGDVGCAAAPMMIGAVTDRLVTADWLSSSAMRGGFAVCMVFPALLVVGLWLLRKRRSV